MDFNVHLLKAGSIVLAVSTPKSWFRGIWR